MYTMQKSPERKLKLCCLPTCKGKRYDLVHKFPMNNERAQQWIDKIDLPELRKMPLDKVRMRYFVCTKHFRPQDYKNCESRSLNTTAYPRLLLKLNEDDQSEVFLPNSSDTIANTQECEYTAQEATFEISETQYTKIEPAHEMSTVKTVETSTPIQYIVCSSASKASILLKKQRNDDSDIVIQKPIVMPPRQKLIPVKAVESPVAIDYKNVRVINNKVQIGSAHALRKANLKRGTANYSTGPIRKKAHFESEIVEIEIEAPTVPNKEMPSEKVGMIVIEHHELEQPLRVCSFWLRDHCRCSNCYGDTLQRKGSITDIPLDVEATELKTENENLLVKWSDGHESSYNILELNEQLMSKTKPSIVTPFHWSAADITESDYAQVTLNDYLCNDDVAKNVVASLIKFGFAFIKNVPANLQSTEIAVRRLFPIQKTHFGEMWSFADSKVHNDTAYTNEALPAHNDNTYFSDAAGLQVLHCVNRAGNGGESLLVDGFHVLEKLREQNHESYEYLSKISIPSEYIEDGYHFKHCAPAIIIDPLTNEPNQIRFNMNDRSFFTNLPQEQMFEFYKHYTTLAKKVQSLQNEFQFKLEPGNVVIFDNWRLLHGRTSYTGKRQMVGCYVARSEFLSVARRYGMIS